METQISKFSFGGINALVDGGIEIQESLSFSKSHCSGFGWALKMTGNDTALNWMEILIPPKESEPGQDAPGRDALTRQGYLMAGEAFLSQLWSLDAADPTGRYQFILLFDNQVVQNIHFDVTA